MFISFFIVFLLLNFSTVNKLILFDGVLFSFYFFYRKIKHSENQRCKFFFYFAHPFLFFLCQSPKDKN